MRARAPDPNDLPSYRLKRDGWPSGVEVVNVLDSNAGTLFGVVIENPLPAHTKYGANHDVMRLILCGRGTDDCKQLRSAN